MRNITYGPMYMYVYVGMFATFPNDLSLSQVDENCG